MSFRNRLSILFGLLVLLPIASVAVLLVRSANEIDNGANEARMNQAEYVTESLYTESKDQLRSATQRLAEDISRREAWRMSPAKLYRWLEEQIRTSPQIRSVTLLNARGATIRQLGSADGLNSARINLTRAKKGQVRTLLLAGVGYGEFTANVADLNGAEAVLLRGGDPVAATAEISGSIESDSYTSESGDEYQVGEVSLGEKPEPVRMQLLISKEQLTVLESSPFLIAAFFALLLLAVLFGMIINRSIHTQTKAMLEAAQKIGKGDFSSEVPVSGGDELAGLAKEFNNMSLLVQDQFNELTRTEHRMRDAIHIFGESVIAGDAEALELTVKVITETMEADRGQLWLGDKVITQSGGAASDSSKLALQLAQRPTLSPGDKEIHQLEQDGWAILQARVPRDESGAITVARRARPFNEAEIELMRALLNQLAVISKNLRLNEQLLKQATVDELTGLANRRAFESRFAEEVERARRFSHPLSLIILDVDDFKAVNDRYGHPAGDRVLKQMGGLFGEVIRKVDLAARWGGEEFAVLLPETDLDAAEEVAERVRQLARKLTDPQCTISAGVAELPRHAAAGETLMRAADDAMYRAKKSGKNRVELAEGLTDE